jgi:hydrogenase/urease accessory protein HupE
MKIKTTIISSAFSATSNLALGITQHETAFFLGLKLPVSELDHSNTSSDEIMN